MTTTCNAAYCRKTSTNKQQRKGAARTLGIVTYIAAVLFCFAFGVKNMRTNENRLDHCLHHELRFRSLFDPNGLAFPCDDNGRVDVHALSQPACANYVLARALVGRDYCEPIVVHPRK